MGDKLEESTEFWSMLIAELMGFPTKNVIQWAIKCRATTEEVKRTYLKLQAADNLADEVAKSIIFSNL